MVTVLRHVAIFAIYVLLAVAMTWPLARLLDVAVAYPGDPLLTSWMLSWDVWALFGGGGSVWDANIFHPAPRALTFSENLFALAPLAALLSPFFSPLAVHNLLLLLGFAGSAYGAHVLGVTATRSHAAAFVAGIAYGFCPWRFVHLSHIQFAWGIWLPLLVAVVIAYARRRSRALEIAAGVLFVINGLTNLHYLVFGAAIVAMAICVWRTWRLLIPIALAAIVLVAILHPYRETQRTYAMRGDVRETAIYSAQLRDWVHRDNEEPERRVAPAITATVLFLASLFLIRRHPPAALVFVLGGIALSLGIHLSIYRWLFEHVDVLRGIRAPARWAVLAYLGMALGAAYATSAMKRRGVAAAVFAMLLIAESWRAPIRWYLMPEEVDPVYHWLAKTDVNGAILELPIGDRDFYYLRGAALHHKPIFNGVSGFTPPIHQRLTRAFNADRIDDALAGELKRLDCALVVVHTDALGSNAAEVRRWLGNLRFVRRFEAGITGDYVFALDGEGGATFETPYNEGPFGALDAPNAGSTVDGPLRIRGWALSGAGIRRVRVWLGNKAYVRDARLLPYPALANAFPAYNTDAARFALDLPQRPRGIRSETDVLIELIDHRGRRTTLPHLWLTWR